VRDRPEGVSEHELTRALARGWSIQPARLTYAPVGAGSYHWVADDVGGGRWFVTVDDLDGKSWLGDTRAAVLAGVRRALHTALALREQNGLEFVLAPVLSGDGEAVQPVNSKYAVAVFPFLDGAGGEFGQRLRAGEQGRLIDLLAALHQVTPTAGTPVARLDLSLRPVLEAAIAEPDRLSAAGPSAAGSVTGWVGGPFAGPARALLASARLSIRDLLATFDRLAARVAATPHLVITHGEPHPGNLIQAGGQTLLIDWDTVGLAVPERDLWGVLNDGAEASRYTAVTGRAVDPDALWCYRIRWTLDDLATFTQQLQARHGDTADTREAWQSLQDLVAEAAVQAAADR
jgi:spectinomycin phosphotransferase